MFGFFGRNKDTSNNDQSQDSEEYVVPWGIMKVHEKHLVTIATSKALPDREGWLLKRGEVNKNFQKRWFVLKGNMLFYFEKPEKEPVGMIILEGCCIELAECSETEKFAFLIIFHGNGNRTYTLAADTQEDMEGWMKALSCASYDFMKNLVAELQRQLDEIHSATSQLPLRESPLHLSSSSSSVSQLTTQVNAASQSFSAKTSPSPSPKPPPRRQRPSPPPNAHQTKTTTPQQVSTPPQNPTSALEFNPFNYPSTSVAQQQLRQISFGQLHEEYGKRFSQVFHNNTPISQCKGGTLIEL